MTVTIPRVGPLPGFAPPAVERSRLQNGMDVWIAPKSALPVFSLQVIVRGGGSMDSPAQAGRASLTAELLDEGTRTRNALEISSFIEQRGLDIEVRAGWDACFLAAHGLAAHCADALALIAEFLNEATIPVDEYDRKREERLHALLQERDEPRTVAVKALGRAIFGTDHIFGRPLGGTVDSIRALERDALERYYREIMGPADAQVVLVGDVEPAAAPAAMERTLGTWRAHGRRPQVLPPPPPTPLSIHLIHRPGAAQSEVRFGHTGPGRSTTDYFPLLVLNTILGGSFKSRLNMTLREEKGFTYGASTSFSFRRAGGAFSGGAAVFTGATAETVALSLAEIRAIREHGVSAEELSRARNYLSIGFMRNFETTGDIAHHLAEVALYDLPADYLATYAERVAAVTGEDVAYAAARYLQPDQLAVVVVADRAQVLEPLRRLELAEVSEWEPD